MATYQYKVQTPKGVYGFESRYAPTQTPQLTSSFQKVFGISPQSFTQSPFTIGAGGKAVFGGAAPAPAPAPAPSPVAPAPQPATISMAQLGPTATEFAAGQTAIQQAGTSSALDPYKQTLGQYTEALGRLESPYDIYQRVSTEQGLPQQIETVTGLRGEVGKTEDLLRNLEEDILSRTSSMDVSEAQRRRIGTFEGAPLQKQYGELSTALGRQEQNLVEAMSRAGMLTGYAIQGQEQTLRPLEAQMQGQQYIGGVEMDALSDRLAREQSGFTADREMQYNLLMDKLGRDRQLSDREWQLARDLEAESRDFARQKTLISMQKSGSGGLTDYQKAGLESDKEARAQARKDEMFAAGRSLVPTHGAGSAKTQGWTKNDSGAWISAWNSLNSQYPEMSSKEIDNALGISGGWSAGPWNK